MKTAIVYCSKHGTTEKIAGLIADKLDGEEVSVINLDKDNGPDPEIFDRIIVGGSIHEGSIQKRVKQFYTKNLQTLLRKELGLFICYLNKEKQNEQFEHAFPQELREHSKARGYFGGELLFERMNFLDRWIVRIVAKKKENVSEIDYPAIDRFVADLKPLDRKESKLNENAARQP